MLTRPTALGSRRTRRQVLHGARRIHRERLVVGTTGNVSALEKGRLWITPSRVGYGAMRPRDLVAVDLATGAVLSRGEPSLELPIHLATYRKRPDVAAVVHTHSPYATAASIAPGFPLADVEDLPYHGLDRVGIVGRSAPGSLVLAQETSEALANANAAFLCGHGIVCVAETVEMAVTRAAVIEHAARVEHLSRALGNLPASAPLIGGTPQLHHNGI